MCLGAFAVVRLAMEALSRYRFDYAERQTIGLRVVQAVPEPSWPSLAGWDH